jgi:hypothetical protein
MILAWPIATRVKLSFLRVAVSFRVLHARACMLKTNRSSLICHVIAAHLAAQDDDRFRGDSVQGGDR